MDLLAGKIQTILQWAGPALRDDEEGHGYVLKQQAKRPSTAHPTLFNTAQSMLFQIISTAPFSPFYSCIYPWFGDQQTQNGCLDGALPFGEISIR